MTLYFISFFSGVLTILAPCVLPVLPVIIGGSIQQGSLKKTLIICLSFMISIILFTFLLKATSIFIGVDPVWWKIISGGILIGFGLVVLFPQIRENIVYYTGLGKSNMLVSQAKAQRGIRGDVLLGAALGPVFSTCSPTYALILAVILPISLVQGTISIIFYALGIGLMLFAVSMGGITLTKRIRRLTDPRGRFKRILAFLIILAGIGIITGYDKKLQILILDAGFFDITKVEQALLDPYLNVQNSQKNISKSDEHPLFNTNIPAPALAGLTNWMNFSGVDSLDELKGKVVLVDFRTYSCINCQRTLPYLQKRHERYADQGLVILGIHAPEFQFEKDPQNVMKALKQFGITYPVVQDNNFQTRRNFKNQYRPAKYIIDPEGRVRYTHFGEGEYEETERVIQTLLQRTPDSLMSGASDLVSINIQEKVGHNASQTAETYLGTARRETIDANGAAAVYVSNPQTAKSENIWRTEGEWGDTVEHIVLQSQKGSLTIRAYAREFNLVLGPGESAEPIEVQVFVDGIQTTQFKVDSYNLYPLFKNPKYGTHIVELRFSQPGVQAYAYTFG